MINKKILSAACVAAIATGFSTGSMADTAVGNATATVLAPLSVTETAADTMGFGSVAGDLTAATTVVLAAANGTSSADGAYTDGLGTAGSFDVAGAGALAYTIGLPADGTVTLTDNGGAGGTAMAVSAFTDNSGGTNLAPTVDNLVAGNGAFTVGATLNIGINQTASTYNGAYTITVNYQ